MNGYLQITVPDLVKSLFVTFVSAALSALLEVIRSGGLSLDRADLASILTMGVIAGLSYLIKQLGTDDNGKLGGKI